ncbi:MAG: hypothetical protein ABF502_13715, partial [Acetobacter sp.]|uniref:hypothetical protein n=1 Tax=Acetobacter sp. TaxID=440 RepID=UPI0039E8A867
MSELRAHAPRLAGALCLWAALVLWGSGAVEIGSRLTVLPVRESVQVYRLCATAAAAPFMVWPFLVRGRRLAFWLPLGLMLSGAAMLAATQATPPYEHPHAKPAVPAAIAGGGGWVVWAVWRPALAPPPASAPTAARKPAA